MSETLLGLPYIYKMGQSLTAISNLSPTLGESCAVVGNSGRILNAEHGKLIDSHDFIIRFNQASTENYEKHVGSRTSLRIINSHMFGSLDSNSEEFVKHCKENFSNFDPEFLLKITNQALFLKNNGILTTMETQRLHYVLEALRKNNCTFFVLSPQLMQAVGTELNFPPHIEPSNGAIGVYMALMAFKKVSCFGFSFYDQSDKTPHYYETINIKDQSCHAFDKEKEWMLGLQEQGRLELYL